MFKNIKVTTICPHTLVKNIIFLSRLAVPMHPPTLKVQLSVFKVQSNFDGSNIFGTIENCSRHGWFEPLRVNYDAKSGSKWR